MKILAFLLSVCLLSACSQQASTAFEKQENSQNELAAKVVKPIQEIPLERLQNPAEIKIDLPDVKDFWDVVVYRKSEFRNENGRMIKPFYEAEIRVGLKNEPKIGDKITVIPLKVNLEPFQLAIVRTEKKDESCTDKKKEFYWETYLEKITAKEILDINPTEDRADEFPFDAAIIYPNVEFARSIDASKLWQAIIPKGVSLKTINAAIDLNNDGKPDLIEAVYCCSNPSETFNSENDCYTCKKTFKKMDSKWKEINFAQPC